MEDNTAKIPLSDLISNRLRTMILEGELKPGERLMEIQFAEKMGVSRTPFREAIRKLELEGLVTLLPRRGAHVSVLSKKDMREVLQIRAALDGLATSLASENAQPSDIENLQKINNDFAQRVIDNDIPGQIASDVDFHEYIYKISKNERLINLNLSLKDQIYRYRVLYLKNFSNAEQITKEHNEIITNIKNNYNHRAKDIAEIHIFNQQENILRKKS